MFDSMDTKRNSPSELTWLSRHFGVILVVIGAIGLLAAVIALTVYVWYFPGPINREHGEWGVFGDFFGGSLNPILAFLGLIALLLTLFVQSRELEISRGELKASREQLARSAKAQEKSEVSLNKQVKLQNKKLASTVIQLKITSLQASLKAVDFEAYAVNETGRPRYAANVTAVVEKMNKLVEELETLIQDD